MARDRLTGHTGTYVDQVLRREAFQKAHPSVEIHSPDGGRERVATWDEENASSSTDDHAVRTARATDVLEDRFGVPGASD